MIDDCIHDSKQKHKNGNESKSFDKTNAFCIIIVINEKKMIPLTIIFALWVVFPAEFFAKHVYKPLCFWSTLRNSKELPISPIDISSTSRYTKSMGCPSNNQKSLMGWSPSRILHVIITLIPEVRLDGK